VPVLDFKTGLETGQTVSLDPEIFNQPVRTDIIHNVFHYYRCADWQTTHRTKRRADLAYSSKKMRTQKKTGKARMSTTKAAHFRGGAKAHGPVPRDHSFSLNKKLVLKGMTSLLSARFAEGNLKVVHSLPEVSKTRDVKHFIPEDSQFLLVHAPKFAEDFSRAVANLPKVHPELPSELDVKKLLKVPTLVLTVAGLEHLQASLRASKLKLYSNRKLYRKVKEEKAERSVEAVPITFKPLKELVVKYGLEMVTK
jgi:large subunit ribosomal protein L4